ncbi:MAG: 3-keto-5-aminohexanoate cleavage enzyme [Pseudomonadota bacterium]
MSTSNSPASPSTPRASRKVVITCAVTGAIHTPSMSPYLPITADEIAQAAIEAAEAGAAIVHLHARDPKDGRPDQTPAAFEPFLREIHKKSEVVINITTGGAPTMLVEERLKPCAHFKPEVASLNMGSMNFGLYPMLNRYKEFKYDWERSYLEGSDERIFKNTFRDIENILRACADNHTRFEIECYDIGHLYTLSHFADRGLIKPPFFIQSVFGILGGIGGHPEDVSYMRQAADRLFGNDYVWSVLGAGKNQLAIAAQSVAMGGNIRVGLEDSLWIRPGQLAKKNAEQVTAARQIVEGLGLSVATPDEARQILKLKGKAGVNL